MEDKQNVQGADEDRMGSVCGPAGRRGGRERVTVRGMVKLEEESDGRVRNCQFTVLCAGESGYIRLCIAHPSRWSHELSSLPDTVGHGSESRCFPYEPVYLLVHVLKCSWVPLCSIREDVLA